MTKKSRRNSDDDVESLAHDLLGVDLNASDDVDDPLEVDGLGLDDLGFGLPEPPAAEIVAEDPVDDVTDSVQGAAVPEIAQEDDDPVAWLVSASKNPPQAGSAAVDDLDDEDDGFGAGIPDFDDEESDVAEVKESPPSDPARDAYWDALDDLDFGTSPEKPSEPADSATRSHPSNRRGKTRTTTPSRDDSDSDRDEKRKKKRRPPKRNKSPAADASSVGDADDGFGTGILEDSGSLPKSIDDVYDDGEFAVDDVVSDDEDQFGSDLASDDDFGAGLEVEPQPPGRPKRRRAPKRKRVDRTTEKAATPTSKTAQPRKERPADHESEPKKAPTKKKDRYANIPTWEEAISYLDLKTQKNTNKKYSSQKPSGKSGDGRGNRRRGRGRKPKE